MFLFFTFDFTILLAFLLLGVLVLGGSIKELAAFIVDEIHIVYPAFVAILAAVMLVYYIVKKYSIKSFNDNSFDAPRLKERWQLELDRRIIVFIINSPLVILSPISAIQSLATYIHEMGFGGFIIAFMMFFVFLLAVYLILWLFTKAWEWADEKDKSFGRFKMFLVSIGFLVLQYILFIITQIK